MIEAGVKLEADGIVLDYEQPRTGKRFRALAGAWLRVAEGEFACVVGPSGCGKTSFLQIVGGLLRPTAGRVLIDGRAVTGPRSELAMVFQEPSLLPWRTVLGNTMYGLELQGRASPETLRRARQIIALVGLAGFEGHYPHELSGGMQQRVNLARALAVDPEVLLMDEPFAALDAQTRELMQQELLRIQREAGKTVLFVTHQISEAIYLGDRVIVLSGRPGQVKAEVTVDLPRPRPLAVKRQPRFLEIEDRIWDLIEVDARQALLAGANQRAE
jgi:NitT/TauT family transport system ATP-binding protein